jgi:hypothetical protein
MARRLVWLIPFIIVLATCALNHEGSGNVIPPSDAGNDAHSTGGSSGLSEGGLALPDVAPSDAVVGH